MEKITKNPIVLFRNKLQGSIILQSNNKRIPKTLQIIGNILLVAFLASVLALSIRGYIGNPTPADLQQNIWTQNGPFELSPERGRFALLYSLVEFHSFQLPVSLARFATPDVGYIGHSYVTIFAPSVSLLAIPGYIIGKYFGASQVGAFATESVFAIFNVLLIRAIAKRLGAHSLAATIAGLAFLFGTPAYPYAVTLYEHHISTFVILSGLYLLIRYNNFYSLAAIWLLYGFSFTVDYPNLFLMLPIAVAAFFRITVAQKVRNQLLVHISVPKIVAIVAVIIPLVFLLWVNNVSYGNPFQLSGSIDNSPQITASGKPVLESSQKIAAATAANEKYVPAPDGILAAFQNKNMLNGMYILFLSPDRGVIRFTPVMLFSIFGIVFAIKRKMPYTTVLLGILGFDIILYSMWGDPYGGWAFGPRYLIPGFAIASIFLAQALTKLRKYNLFLLLFFFAFIYSVGVNTLGALTSNSNPPEIQVAALEQQTKTVQKYSWDRNVDEIMQGKSKSFVFLTYAGDYITAWDYYMYITLYITFVSGFILVMFKIIPKSKQAESTVNGTNL